MVVEFRHLHRLVHGQVVEDLRGPARRTGSSTREIHWPTSGTTQVFHDRVVDQAVEVTELTTTGS